MTSRELTLAAQDANDLEIISARLQDAVTQVGDLAFLPKSRRFAAVFNRFRWEAKDDSRIRAGLSIDSVSAARARNIRRQDPEAVVSLLALRFAPRGGEDPGGLIELIFAGGGTLQLDVECVDVVLTDMGEPYPARARPDHESAA